MPAASIIISVYNRIDFLRLVLAGFETQTERDFEIIISDDGSGPDFVDELNKIIAASPVKIRHNRHEDLGFRKNRILNESIRMAASDYLIFADGDCIPHPAFVQEHLSHKEHGVCLAGRRVDLSEDITRRLTPENIRKGILQSAGMKCRMFAEYLRMRLFHVMNGIYFKNRILRKFSNRKERGLLGANFSLHKTDMMAINGFDERYTTATYGEDSDVELRLRLHGIRLRTVLNMAVQYHCYHQPLPRPEASRLQYETALAEQRAFTPYGIIKKHENTRPA